MLGQDDAGPVGLHLRDLAALRAFAGRWLPPSRASIEPGADELGMVLVAAALARAAQTVPRVRVVYSRADGGSIEDPLEFAPIATTIADLIRSCGAVQVTGPSPADVDLFVRVPGTGAADETAFVTAIEHDTGRAAGSTDPPAAVAVADLSFLAANDYAEQRRLTQELIARRLAGRIDAFASWNTVANTVGTALPEAVAVRAGRLHGNVRRASARDVHLHALRRRRRLPRRRPAEAERGSVRAGVDDHTFLSPDVAQRVASENRALLWPEGLALLAQIEPQFRDAGFTITLPWDRTFETELDVRLAPR